MKADEKTGVSPLSAIVKAESLYRLLNDENTSVLYLEVLQAGGTDRITRNLLRGSKLRYSGSAVAQYMLFDKDGAIKLSKTVYFHTGFLNLDRPEGKTGRDNFEIDNSTGSKAKSRP